MGERDQASGKANQDISLLIIACTRKPARSHWSSQSKLNITISASVVVRHFVLSLSRLPKQAKSQWQCFLCVNLFVFNTVAFPVKVTKRSNLVFFLSFLFGESQTLSSWSWEPLSWKKPYSRIHLPKNTARTHAHFGVTRNLKLFTSLSLLCGAIYTSNQRRSWSPDLKSCMWSSFEESLTTRTYTVSCYISKVIKDLKLFWLSSQGTIISIHKVLHLFILEIIVMGAETSARKGLFRTTWPSLMLETKTKQNC